VLDLEVTGDLAQGILIRWIDILVSFIGAADLDHEHVLLAQSLAPRY
jgi:hypothetical protein